MRARDLTRYDTEGQNQSFQSYSNQMTTSTASFKKDEFRTFEDVTSDDSLGMSDKPDYFSTRATITFIKSDNLSYPACPTEKCNKKMSQEGNDEWRCEKCSQTYPAPEYRLSLSLPTLYYIILSLADSEALHRTATSSPSA